MNLGKWLLSAVVVTFSACGAPKDTGFIAADIKSGVPTGTLGGTTWTMTKAVVRKDTKLDVTLYADSSVADCGTGSANNTVFWTQPATIGEVELSLGSESQTITFYDGDTNYIFIDGLINVSALDATNVTIGLVAKTSKGNTINGTFTTALCP